MKNYVELKVHISDEQGCIFGCERTRRKVIRCLLPEVIRSQRIRVHFEQDVSHTEWMGGEGWWVEWVLRVRVGRGEGRRQWRARVVFWTINSGAPFRRARRCKVKVTYPNWECRGRCPRW
jgi:hypothetical protein